MDKDSSITIDINWWADYELHAQNVDDSYFKPDNFNKIANSCDLFLVDTNVIFIEHVNNIQ